MSDNDDEFPCTPWAKRYNPSNFPSDPFDRLPQPPAPDSEQWLVNLVHREQWGAAPSAREAEPLDPPVANVVVHWTDSPRCETQSECGRAVLQLQRKHLELGRPDIQYNFLMGGDGFVYEGLGWTRGSDMLVEVEGVEGASVVIGLIGTKNDSSPLMKTSLTSLLTMGSMKGFLRDDHGILLLTGGAVSSIPATAYGDDFEQDY